MMTLVHFAFWASFLVLAHVLVGYPLCMLVLARWFPQPVAKRAVTPAATVILTVHNDARHILAKLQNINALDYPAANIEIVIACDGCTDATAALARQSKDPRVRVLEFPRRRGKAACLNDAVAVARGEVLLMTEVRQQLAPGALRELVANLADITVGVVGGELQMENIHTRFAQGIDTYWRYEKMIRRAESMAGSSIGVSGAVYVMRRVLFDPLPPETVLDSVLIPMRVAALGCRVVFEPRAVAWDQPMQQPQHEEQRKVKTLAGNYQLLALAPWLLSPSANPLWFRFVSHKLLRLWMPWWLLLLAASAAAMALRHAIYVWPLFCMFVVAMLAVLGRLSPAATCWLPVRLALTFYYLNLFAAQGTIAFGRNRGSC